MILRVFPVRRGQDLDGRTDKTEEKMQKWISGFVLMLELFSWLWDLLSQTTTLLLFSALIKPHCSSQDVAILVWARWIKKKKSTKGHFVETKAALKAWEQE